MATRAVQVVLSAVTSAYRAEMLRAARDTHAVQTAAAGTGAAVAGPLSSGFKTAAKHALYMSTVLAGPAALGSAFIGSAKAAIQFEADMTKVSKTVDPTARQLEQLSTGFRQLSTELPATTTEIADVGMAAGQLGIRTENIQSFTDTMIRLGFSTNVSAEQAAMSLAQLANVTRLPQGQFSNLGSTVVWLGNNLATTEDQIVHYGHRLAGAGEIVGMTEAEILALGASMAELGIPAERGGTAMQKVLLTINSAVDEGGEKMHRFAEISGMSAKRFSTMWKQDPAQAVIAFIEGLDRIEKSGGNAETALRSLELTDQRLIQAMLSLSGASEDLQGNFDGATRAFKNNTDLMKESGKFANTTQAKIQRMTNAFKSLGVELGEGTLKSIGGFSDWAVKATNATTRWLDSIEGRGIKVFPGLRLAVDQTTGRMAFMTSAQLKARKSTASLANSTEAAKDRFNSTHVAMQQNAAQSEKLERELGGLGNQTEKTAFDFSKLAAGLQAALQGMGSWTEPLAGYQEMLGEANSAAKESFDKRRDLEKKLAENAKQAAQEMADARRSHNDAERDARKRYHEEIVEAERGHRQALREADRSFYEGRRDAHRDHAEDLADAREKLNEKLRDLDRDYYQDRREAHEDHADDIAKAERKLQEELVDANEERAEKLLELEREFGRERRDLIKDRAKDLFDTLDLEVDLEKKRTLSIEAVTKSVMKQNQALQQWLNGLGKLRAQGLSEATIAALNLDEFSEESLAIIRNWAGATDAEIEALNKSIARRQQMAGKQAQTEAEKMIGALGEQLRELARENAEQTAEIHAEHAKQVREANQEYAEAVRDANKGLSETLRDLRKSHSEAVAEAKRDHAKQVSEANKELAEKLNELRREHAQSVKEANREFAQAQKEATKGLGEALREAGREFRRAVAGIKSELAEKNAAERATAASTDDMFNEMEASFDVYMESLNKRLQDQRDWHKNLNKIRQAAGNEYADMLAAQGMEEADLVAEIAKQSNDKIREAKDVTLTIVRESIAERLKVLKRRGQLEIDEHGRLGKKTAKALAEEFGTSKWRINRVWEEIQGIGDEGATKFGKNIHKQIKKHGVDKILEELEILEPGVRAALSAAQEAANKGGKKTGDTMRDRFKKGRQDVGREMNFIPPHIRDTFTKSNDNTKKGGKNVADTAKKWATTGKKDWTKEFNTLPPFMRDMLGRAKENADKGGKNVNTVLSKRFTTTRKDVGKQMNYIPPHIRDSMNTARDRGREGAEKTGDAMNTKLSNKRVKWGKIAWGYAKDLQAAMNPVIVKLGGKKIKFPDAASARFAGRAMQGRADGGIDFPRFANGGTHRPAAHITNQPMVLYGEPETHGEAYIPFAPSKKTRSRKIAHEAVHRLGGDVTWTPGAHQTSHGVERFADGGMHGGAQGATKDKDNKGGHGGPMRVHPGLERKMEALVAMKIGGIVAAGRAIQRKGYAVGEHPLFGGVAPVHTANSYHYRGQAIDVNWRGAGSEGRKLDQLQAWILANVDRSKIRELIWRAAGHYSHLHLAMSGKGSGMYMPGSGILGPAIEMPDLPKIPKGDGSVISKAAILAMRRMREQAQEWMSQWMMQPGLGGLPPAASGSLQKMAQQLLKRRGWLKYWSSFNTLVQKESSWNPRAQNPTSTAYGLGQFLDSTWATVGGRKTSNPQLQLEYMMRYIQRRYGNPSKALAFHLRNNWYDQGGLLKPGVNVSMNGTGAAEVVAAKGMIRREVSDAIGSGNPTAVAPSLAGARIVIEVPGMQASMEGIVRSVTNQGMRQSKVLARKGGR